jgi:hypothetical protein
MIQKIIGKLRQSNLDLTQSNIQQWPIEKFGIKNYRGLRTALIREFKRQKEIYKKRAALRLRIDPLILQSQNRWDRLMKIYLRAANFAGNTVDRDNGDLREIADYNSQKRMALVRVNGWGNYSSRYGAFLRKAGLVLYDSDSSAYRFLRVGPDIETIDEALEYIKPAAVKRAESSGKRVLRQGDIYFIPQKTWNLRALDGTNHQPVEENEQIIIRHPTHSDLILESPHKAVRQILAHNGSFGGAGRRSGHAD